MLLGGGQPSISAHRWAECRAERRRGMPCRETHFEPRRYAQSDPELARLVVVAKLCNAQPPGDRPSLAFDFGGMSLTRLGQALANFGFRAAAAAHAHVFAGFEYLGIILVTAIPFGIYDLVEAMDNVASAEAAGDAYPTTQVLTADGVVSPIGCLMGNPFINANPHWTSRLEVHGGRNGYSAATGLLVIALSSCGPHRLFRCRLSHRSCSRSAC
jgi:hypothetical protein